MLDGVQHPEDFTDPTVRVEGTGAAPSVVGTNERQGKRVKLAPASLSTGYSTIT